MVLFVDYRIIMIIVAIALTALLSRRALSTYSIPKSGSIELIADGGETSYQFAERRLPLEACPIDAFGTRTVALPKTEATMRR